MLHKGHLQLLLFSGMILLYLLSPAVFSFEDSVLPNQDDNQSDKCTGKESLILKKQVLPGIDNFLKISNLLYSGGTPEDEEAFKILVRLGIKTIISVDGNRPQVELAKKLGMKYVHIPIGYDGIHENESSAFVRVVKECPQPFYFHCHHGKHRGPAAAAIASISLNQISNMNAVKILVKAGTSQDFKGLWNDVKNYQLPTSNQVLPELHEVSEVNSLTTVMVKMDERFIGIQQWLKKKERLKKKKPTDIHLKSLSSKETQSVIELSILLAEDFRESSRNLASKVKTGDIETGDYESGFQHMLVESENLARKLNQSLKSGNLNLSRENLLSLKKSCNHCHQSHRN
jgi:protein tyrosine phosphatase (PTP) superfamily phosphohydrolase (DUF442 family)